MSEGIDHWIDPNGTYRWYQGHPLMNRFDGPNTIQIDGNEEYLFPTAGTQDSIFVFSNGAISHMKNGRIFSYG